METVQTRSTKDYLQWPGLVVFQSERPQEFTTLNSLQVELLEQSDTSSSWIINSIKVAAFLLIFHRPEEILLAGAKRNVLRYILAKYRTFTDGNDILLTPA